MRRESKGGRSSRRALVGGIGPESARLVFPATVQQQQNRQERASNVLGATNNERMSQQITKESRMNRWEEACAGFLQRREVRSWLGELCRAEEE